MQHLQRKQKARQRKIHRMNKFDRIKIVFGQMVFRCGVLLLLAVGLLHPHPVSAQPAPAAEQQAALESAIAVRQIGPVDVSLQGGGTLRVPAGHVFVRAAEANRLLVARGVSLGKPVIGFVEAVDGWLSLVYCSDEGHISASDAQDLRDKASIEERGQRLYLISQGRSPDVPAQVLSLRASPSYDATRHHLRATWYYEDRTSPGNPGGVETDQVFVLTRSGYFFFEVSAPVTSVMSEARAAQLRGRITALINGLSIMPDQAYERFDPAQDRSAGRGLVALVIDDPTKAER